MNIGARHENRSFARREGWPSLSKFSVLVPLHLFNKGSELIECRSSIHQTAENAAI